MMLWLLPILIRRGISDTIAKPLAWLANVLIVMALLAAVLFGLWKVMQVHDAGIATDAVQERDRDITAEAAARVTNAMEAADANQMARDERAVTADKELQREVDTKGTNDVAGPAVSGVLDRVREQQAAGRRR